MKMSYIYRSDQGPLKLSEKISAGNRKKFHVGGTHFLVNFLPLCAKFEGSLRALRILRGGPGDS